MLIYRLICCEWMFNIESFIDFGKELERSSTCWLALGHFVLITITKTNKSVLIKAKKRRKKKNLKRKRQPISREPKIERMTNRGRGKHHNSHIESINSFCFDLRQHNNHESHTMQCKWNKMRLLIWIYFLLAAQLMFHFGLASNKKLREARAADTRKEENKKKILYYHLSICAMAV